MNKKQKKTIEFALCYLIANRDDENIINHLEEITENRSSFIHTQYLQGLIDAVELEKNHE